MVNHPSITCSWFVWLADFSTIGGIKWRFETRLNKTLEINYTESNTHFIFVRLWTVSIAVQLSVTGFLGIWEVHLKFFFGMFPPKRLWSQFQILFRFWVRKFVNFGNPRHWTHGGFHWKSLKQNLRLFDPGKNGFKNTLPVYCRSCSRIFFFEFSQMIFSEFSCFDSECPASSLEPLWWVSVGVNRLMNHLPPVLFSQSPFHALTKQP